MPIMFLAGLNQSEFGNLNLKVNLKIKKMKKIFLSLIIMTSCGVQSQENYLEEKKEAIQLIKK